LAELFCIERGEGDLPLVLLHGFGGSHAAWDEVAARLEGSRRLLIYDLPGHAGSLAVPAGSAAVAAKAIISDLARHRVASVHLVGHSMGGAAAALVALREPGRIASLTLLSPGGFGPEVNEKLLRRYAAAVDEAEIAGLLEEFFGPGHALPDGLTASQAGERQVAGATDALLEIVETFFDGKKQKVLPLDDLARLGMPIRVLWGAQDRVLPAVQARRLTERFAVRIFDGVGHMLPYEIPAEVAALVLEATA
jgi:pyruvate dehydrogenase E2 component (dihydrolipoamide acetyltransferase)